MSNLLLTLLSFRKTMAAVVIVGIILTYLELETLTTYLVAVFVSLVHPFYEKYEQIEKNIHDEQKELDVKIKKYKRNKAYASTYIKIALAITLIALIVMSIIERWPFLIDWIIPK